MVVDGFGGGGDGKTHLQPHWCYTELLCYPIDWPGISHTKHKVYLRSILSERFPSPRCSLIRESILGIKKRDLGDQTRVLRNFVCAAPDLYGTIFKTLVLES